MIDNRSMSRFKRSNVHMHIQCAAPQVQMQWLDHTDMEHPAPRLFTSSPLFIEKSSTFFFERIYERKRKTVGVILKFSFDGHLLYHVSSSELVCKCLLWAMRDYIWEKTKFFFSSSGRDICAPGLLLGMKYLHSKIVIPCAHTQWPAHEDAQNWPVLCSWRVAHQGFSNAYWYWILERELQ